MQENIGNNIKRLRKQHGMTQKELGVALGFSKTTAYVRIAQYESGARTPKKNLINRIACVFDVSPAVLTAQDAERRMRLSHTLDELEGLCAFMLAEIAEMRNTIQ